MFSPWHYGKHKMYAESFHKVLKVVYFNRKQNRRVDNLLLMLLKICRDKQIDQIIKFEKGKTTHRMKKIRARHKQGERILGIQELCDNEWPVPSSSQTDVTYTVNNVCQLHVPVSLYVIFAIYVLWYYWLHGLCICHDLCGSSSRSHCVCAFFEFVFV